MIYRLKFDINNNNKEIVSNNVLHLYDFLEDNYFKIFIFRDEWIRRNINSSNNKMIFNKLLKLSDSEYLDIISAFLENENINFTLFVE